MTHANPCGARSRRLCLAPILFLSVLPIHAAFSATPVQGVPHNSPDAFLPIPAANLESVLEQVQSNPAVRRHYARYFHMPQSRVAPYFRANLTPSRLSHGGLYTVYYVRANGLIYPTLLTVPAGSPVFALRNGTPVLMRKEGSPLTPTRKAVRLNTAAPAKPPKPVASAAPPPMEVIIPNHAETTVVPPPSVPSQYGGPDADGQSPAPPAGPQQQPAGTP